jgi:hypothetical protein
LAPLAVLVVAALGSPLVAAPAQAPPGGARQAPQARTSAIPSDDRLFAEAEKAVAAGEADRLLAAADATLARTPGDRAATASKVAVWLAKGDPAAALDAYGAWAKATRQEDTLLLGRLATGVLRHLDRSPLAEIRARALEARASREDADARKLLAGRRTAGPQSADSWESTLALARLGDASAVAEVARAIGGAAGSRKAAGLAALRGVPTSAEVVDTIRAALQDGDDMVRDAAADAATGRREESLRGPLRDVARSARFTAPLRAAVALVRMGDDTERSQVDAALATGLPDARLLAARAYVGRPETAWIARIEPLLGDANTLYRIFAAELLLPVRAAEAMRALEPILADENPVLEAEATRVVASSPSPPIGLLRAALGDANPWVRLHAATALAGPRPAAAKP